MGFGELKTNTEKGVISLDKPLLASREPREPSILRSTVATGIVYLHLASFGQLLLVAINKSGHHR